MRSLRATLVLALVVSLSALVAGCGGGERQDENEKSGTFKVDVPSAVFPAKQHLAEPAVLSIAVKNTDDEALPNVAVTIDTVDETGKTTLGGFNYASKQPDLSDPSRPAFIVDQGPLGGDTAYVGTWALGALGAGQTKTFKWKVTPVKAGAYKIKYQVAAGLNGKAKAELAGGGAAAGIFSVDVDGEPAEARVDPKTGDVIREGEQPEK